MRSPYLLPLFGLMFLAGCTAAPKRAASPPVSPKPLAAPDAPEPDWRDLPLSPGRWVYAADATGTAARFGPDGVQPALIVRCDRTAGAIRIIRHGAGAGPMTITTSYGPRDLPTTPGEGGAMVTLAAADPLLDRIAFSRGRVTYEMAALPLLVTPAWAEPARVIEDCRG